jgi:Septum formation initiator
MLCVLVAIVYLYLSAGLSLFSSWRESRRDNARLAMLERENRSLTVQRETASGQGELQVQARRLGMIRPGEQGYVVSGLPAN